jgi:uncharacterized protein YjgD (DUF1641 family)
MYPVRRGFAARSLGQLFFDRDIQRSLGFALGFAARFGQNLAAAPAETTNG